MHDHNVHQKRKPHACRVCNKMFGEKFNRNKVRSTCSRAPARMLLAWTLGAVVPFRVSAGG